MLFPSNFSIKRLVSQRRTPKDDGEPFYFEQEDMAPLKTMASKENRTWSWGLPRRKSKGLLGPVLIVSQPQLQEQQHYQHEKHYHEPNYQHERHRQQHPTPQHQHHRHHRQQHSPQRDAHWLDRLDHFPDTPNSSKSSLCSCEHHHHPAFAPPPLPPWFEDPAALCPGGLAEAHQAEGGSTKRPRATTRTPSPASRVPSPKPTFPTRSEQHLSEQHPEQHLPDQHSPERPRRPLSSRSAPNLLQTLPLLLQVHSEPGPTLTAPDSEWEVTCEDQDKEAEEAEAGGVHQEEAKENQETEAEKDECLQQLIRETDEAFGLVGAGIDTPYFKMAEKTKSDLPARTRSGRQDRPRKPVKKAAPSPLSRQGSVHKSKRRAAPRKSPPGSKRTTRPAKRRAPKWADSARELLNGHFFSRLEVQEVLPASRLEEIRLCRSSSALGMNADEPVETEETESPSEPSFLLQSPPFHIDADGLHLDADGQHFSELPCVEEQPKAPVVSSHPDESATTAAETEGNGLVSRQENLQEACPMAYQDVSFSQPPPVVKSPLRLHQRKQIPPLPTIPETATTTAATDPSQDTHDTTPRPSDSPFLPPPDSVLSLPPPSSPPYFSPPSPPPGHMPSMDETFVLLPCNPHTSAMPGVRHGPVRLSRADLAVASGSSSSKLASAPPAVDETLDWTAFQMAILGGAGDLLGEATDYSRQSYAADEVDGLCDWFDSFGFENPGLLVAEHGPLGTTATAAGPRSSINSNAAGPRRRIGEPAPGRASTGSAATATTTATDASDTTVTDITATTDTTADTAGSVGEQHARGFWNQGPFDARRFYDARSFGLRRRTADGHGHPKRYVKSLDLGDDESSSWRRGCRPRSVESFQSLPQSPMPDLTPVDGGKGSGVVVPMGYNLGHDLGEFLRWEAEHVCAAAFAGPGGTEPAAAPMM